MLHQVPLSENAFVREIFVSGLASVEHIGGGNFRFTFYILENGKCVDRIRLIANAEAVPAALVMAAKAIGLNIFAGNSHVDPRPLH